MSTKWNLYPRRTVPVPPSNDEANAVSEETGQGNFETRSPENPKCQRRTRGVRAEYSRLRVEQWTVEEQWD